MGLRMSDVAIALTRLWTRAYTVGLPERVREARLAEIESDLWESLHDPEFPQPQILPRLAAGVMDDVRWRAGVTGEESRMVWLTLATGCLLLVAMWTAFAGPAFADAIMGSTWVYPVVQSVHVLSIAMFVGLNVMLDLRLLGRTLRRVPVSEMLSQALPWTTPTGLLAIVTGMALFLGEPSRFIVNPFFQVKAVALVLAVINLAAFHLTIYPRVAEWDEQASPPFPARASAACSLALWAIVLIASRLVAYNWFG